MPPTPVTIITGFLGSGKTTLILNLIPQLPPTYRLALLKNEFGDQAIDSQLASQASISGVQELLNGCICCNLVGQLSDALFTLRNSINPDRIIIETSGSAFPATLAMEVNRVSRENEGCFTLDGVVSVIDVENWKGYDDTSYTAKMQAKYTDLVVFNKWELTGEEAFERCLDRLGDMDVDVAWVKSRKGWVDHGVVLGIDGALVVKNSGGGGGDLEGVDGSHTHLDNQSKHEHEHEHKHEHHDKHQEEVEVLSLEIKPSTSTSSSSSSTTNENEKIAGLSLENLEDLLLSSPKSEIYRIKGLVLSSQSPPADSTGTRRSSLSNETHKIYVLNWAFSRWTYTPLEKMTVAEMRGVSGRLTFVVARGESVKWMGKLERMDKGGWLEGGRVASVGVRRVG